MKQIIKRSSFSSRPILLVSVVNGQEARAAAAGGADIIDLKNPAEGSLGAPTPQIIGEVCAALKGDKPLSIALGEFPGKPGAAALAALGSAYFQPNFIKIAFMPDSPQKEILAALKEIRTGIRLMQQEKTINLVSVAFADIMNRGIWDLADFAAVSQEGGAAGCLIDTWEKKGRSLLDYLSEREIGQFIKVCHDHQLFCGLAGSLQSSHICALHQLGPDIIGVRSAVCGGNRLQGRVSAQSVRDLKELCCRTNN
ncbi:MAG: (5-formylfuran-3-yl)methyl phosphate synthase [Dehalobacterium sp.]